MMPGRRCLRSFANGTAVTYVGGLLPVRHDMPKSRPVDTAPHGEPAKSIGSIVNDLARQFKVSFDRQANSLGLTRPQWQLLLHLHRHEGMTQTSPAGRGSRLAGPSFLRELSSG